MSTSLQKHKTIAAFSAELVGLVDDLAKTTVLVNARKRLPVSGLLIRPNEILTVDHGIEKEDSIEILVADQGLATGKLIGRDPGTDLALIKLEQEIANFQTVNSVPARVGMPVLMIGRPEPEGHQASFGIITAVGNGLRTTRGAVLDHYIATDATPYPGFSGGPLIAFDGNILGVNTSGLVGGLSLAIPMNLAMKAAEQLSRFGRVKRGFLGVRSQRVEVPAPLLEKHIDIPKTGLLVVGLEDDGPAAKSGIIVGDILVDAGGIYLSDQEGLVIFLAGDVAGKEVSFNLLRGGEPLTIIVEVGER